MFLADISFLEWIYLLHSALSAECKKTTVIGLRVDGEHKDNYPPFFSVSGKSE
jgi:hypothetical protein